MEYTFVERVLRGYDRVMSKVETALSVGSISLCGCIFLFTILNRLFFKMPLRWVEEACRMLLVLTVFSAQPVIIRERSQLKLAFLAEVLKGKKAEKVLGTICDLSLMAVFAVIFVLFLQYTIKTIEFPQYSPAMGYPMWVMYGICTLTFLDSAIRALMVCWDDNFSKKKLFPKGGEEFSVN